MPDREPGWRHCFRPAPHHDRADQLQRLSLAPTAFRLCADPQHRSASFECDGRPYLRLACDCLCLVAFRRAAVPKARAPIAAVHPQPGRIGIPGACGLYRLGIYGHDTRGVPWRLPAPIKEFMASNDWSKTCLLEGASGWDAMPIKGCVFNGNHPQTYAIFGDSLASSLTPALAERLDSMNIGLQQITHSFCAPVADVSMVSHQARDCGAFNAAAIDYLIRSRVKTVFLAASWKIFFEQSRYMFKGEEVATSDVGQRLRDAFDRTVGESTSAGIRVVIIYPHPRGDTEIAAKVAKLMHKGTPRRRSRSPRMSFSSNRRRPIPISTTPKTRMSCASIPPRFSAGWRRADAIWRGRARPSFSTRCISPRQARKPLPTKSWSLSGETTWRIRMVWQRSLPSNATHVASKCIAVLA